MSSSSYAVVFLDIPGGPAEEEHQAIWESSNKYYAECMDRQMQQRNIDVAGRGHGDRMFHGSIDADDSADTINLDNHYAPGTSIPPTLLNIADGMDTLCVTASSVGDS